MNARVVALVMVGLFLAASSLQAQEKQIKSAMSAAPASISGEATILDAEGNVLREGSNGWTCTSSEFGPMCLDAPWMNWLEAYMGKTEPTFTRTGFGYMMNGFHPAVRTSWSSCRTLRRWKVCRLTPMMAGRG
jgi:hypothetical protein